MGRLNMAARQLKEIAEAQEKQGLKAEALAFYAQAADLFATENSSSEANKCRLKVAEFSAELERCVCVWGGGRMRVCVWGGVGVGWMRIGVLVGGHCGGLWRWRWYARVGGEGGVKQGVLVCTHKLPPLASRPS